MRVRRWVTAVATLPMALIAGIVSAGPAAADSTVCVAGNDVLASCNQTWGSAGYVHHVTASVEKPKPWEFNICGFNATVRISAYGNPRHRQWTKSMGKNCSWVDAFLQFPVNERLPVNTSYACVTNRIGDRQQGREICIKLTGAVEYLNTLAVDGSLSHRCLDADLNTMGRNGTRVQLWDCNNSLQQRWQQWSDGSIRSARSGRCLDADLNTIGSNGTTVQLWDCNESMQQQWFLNPSDPRGSTAQTSINGRCLDADLNTIHGNGTKVQLWDCNNSTQQRWGTRWF